MNKRRRSAIETVAWVERSDTQGTVSRVSLRSTQATFERYFFCKRLQAMVLYRRDKTPGATWFFTLNLADRRRDLLTAHIDLLRGSFRHVMRLRPWRIDAIVILPDHLHALCTLPPGDADFALRWRLIKSGFSRALPSSERISASRQRKGERGIWQQRFWEHRIRDDEDFARHVDYIHHNPRKHGHVERVVDWPWSSFHRYVAAGLLPADWAGSGDDEMFTGERL